MSKNMYLSFYSNHPKHLLRALPYSQAIRIKRICSNVHECDNEIKEMFNRFMHRGYPQKYLDSCRDKIESMNRNDLLLPRSPWLVLNFKKYHEHLLINTHTTQYSQSLNTPFYIVIPFYANVNLLQHIVHENLNIEISKCLRNEICKILSQWDFKVVYKNGRTLATLLNKRHLSFPTQP